MKIPAISMDVFDGIANAAPSVDRLASDLLGSGRRRVIWYGVAALTLVTLAAVSLSLAPTSRSVSQPLAGTQPLDGNWNCSLGGQPIGTLTVSGWDYALGSDSAPQSSGALKVDILWSKYHEEVIRIQSGALRDRFGVKLGYHYKVAGQPEMLVFSIGPGSGIRCAPLSQQ
jgi:hypothetical protein